MAVDARWTTQLQAGYVTCVHCTSGNLEICVEGVGGDPFVALRGSVSPYIGNVLRRCVPIWHRLPRGFSISTSDKRGNLDGQFVGFGIGLACMPNLL